MAEIKVKAPTKKQNFEVIRQFLEDNGKSDLAKVMEHEIELLSRKSSKGGALTATQKENMVLVEIIKDILGDGSRKTIGELLKVREVAEFETANPNGVNSQRLTGIINPLTTDKGGTDFVREVEKKTAYYRLAWAEDIVEVEGE